MMPVCECARGRMAVEIVFQPCQLRRELAVAQRAVERDDMPCAENEAEIAVLFRVCLVAVVAELACRPLRIGVVIADGGIGARLESPPGRFVASAEFRRRAGRISIVALGQYHRLAVLVQTVGNQGGGLRGAGGFWNTISTIGDVARRIYRDAFSRECLRAMHGASCRKRQKEGCASEGKFMLRGGLACFLVQVGISV